jgi:hypothetical protein
MKPPEHLPPPTCSMMIQLLGIASSRFTFAQLMDSL